MHIIARVGVACCHQNIIFNSFKVGEMHNIALQSACQLSSFLSLAAAYFPLTSN